VPVRLRRNEVEARREANVARLHALLEEFRALDLDPILVSSSERHDILAPFLEWTELRRTRNVIGA
jgi:hypothetical protein